MEYDRFSSKFSRMYYIDLEYILISILSNIYFISDFDFQIRRKKKKKLPIYLIMCIVFWLFMNECWLEGIDFSPINIQFWLNKIWKIWRLVLK
jgi:hypothetical protein